MVIWCFVLLLIGFIYGYITNEEPVPNKPNQYTEEARMPNVVAERNNEEQEPPLETTDEEPMTNVSPAINNDNIVTNNTKLVLRTYYEKTRDSTSKEMVLPKTLIGISLDELKRYLEENYVGWSIRDMNKDRVELYKVSNHVSPNHYIVKEYNGYITIFQVEEDGSMKLINQTEIPISSLSDMDRQKMSEGIIVKGIDGINQLLEDYSS